MVSLICFYLGGFFGDLGGVGGYDGIAPRWLFEKAMNGEYPYLFEASETASIVFLGVSVLLGIYMVGLYLYMLAVIIRRKLKGL